MVLFVWNLKFEIFSWIMALLGENGLLFLQDDYKALPRSHVRPVYPVPVQLQVKRPMPTLVHWPPFKQGFESHGAAGPTGPTTAGKTAGETKNEKKEYLNKMNGTVNYRT